MTDIHILDKSGKRTSPHVWGAGVNIGATEDTPEQRVWVCERCKLEKITLLPNGGRAWRANGVVFFGPEPMCALTEVAT